MKYKYWIAGGLLLLIAGCSAHSRGDCVLVNIDTGMPENTFKAVYIKYSNGRHWFEVNGKIGAVYGYSSSGITSCI